MGCWSSPNDGGSCRLLLWGGDIYGKNVNIVPLLRLQQEWYTKDFPKNKTLVTFTFSEHDERTTVDLLHEYVDDGQYDEVSQGWRDYYMEPLKAFCEEQVK